jgi:Cu2+-exporting ATPase
VVLDKTGTLTHGRFQLARTAVLGPSDEAHCLALARSLEASSRHPIAAAFGKGPTEAVSELKNFPGHGVEAAIEGRRVRVGSEAFCRELAAAPAPTLETCKGETRVFLADQGGWLGAFLLEDAPREDAAGLVAALAARGLRLHLVSGDDPALVEALARRLGIESFAGGVSPQDKFAFAERLQREGRVVAMIGDGLNDAPVLARADVSIAMGGGADAAKLQADLVLLGERLEAIAEGFGAARAAMRVVRQNFGWALAYNAIALPLAAVGLIGPWEAALGMSASSFIVVLNAMRPLAAPLPWKASTSSSRSRSYSYS